MNHHLRLIVTGNDPADDQDDHHDRMLDERDRIDAYTASEAFERRSLTLLEPEAHDPARYSFAYVQTDIPPGVSLCEWRARKTNAAPPAGDAA